MKINKKQADPIVKRVFPEYNGRKYFLELTDKVIFHDTNWDGGTRNKYIIVRTDGEIMDFKAPAPWANPVEGQTFEISPAVAVVCWSIFCGKDCGITIYMNPNQNQIKGIASL